MYNPIIVLNTLDTLDSMMQNALSPFEQKIPTKLFMLYGYFLSYLGYPDLGQT
jgi:hypothetical protein